MHLILSAGHPEVVYHSFSLLLLLLSIFRQLSLLLLLLSVFRQSLVWGEGYTRRFPPLSGRGERR